MIILYGIGIPDPEGGEKMKIYAVEQKYNDHGKVTATIKTLELDVTELPKSYSEEHQNYDYYVDYFKTLKEAEDKKKQALNA